MIAKYAVQDFLKRPLRDSGRAKLFSDRALDAKLASLDPVPKFYTPLRQHQKVGFLLGLKYDGYQFNYDMGLGKSLLILSLFDYARRIHRRTYKRREELPPPYRMLVLVPGTANVGQWRNEVRRHTPHLTCAGVDIPGTAERRQLVESPEADIVVITYVGFLALVCRGKVVLDEYGDPEIDPETGEPKTKGWELDDKKMRRMKKLFRFFCGDESTHYRSPRTLLNQCVKHIAWACDRRYGLTGTPYGKKKKLLESLWGQQYVVDKGETLGGTLGLAREAFCVEKKNQWTGFPEYVFDERKKRALNRMLRHGSIRYEKSECTDLPSKVPVARPVVFDEETWQYYDKLVESIRNSDGAVDVVKSAYQRMRQLTAGYLVLTDAEGGKQVIRFKKAPKIEAVLQWVRELPEGSKAVIFHEYRRTGEYFCEALKKAKVRHVWLYSGAKKKNELVQRFLEDPKVQVMVSSSAGAYGGNWQVANYMAFLESPADPILRRQEEDRIHRMGQNRTCWIYDFYVAGSIDEKIIDSMKDEKSLFDAIVEGRIDLRRRGNKKRVRLKES
jgi:SNF2 family DNA or RNA helicase